MKDKNKRTYPRINTLLPFQVRRLHLDDRKKLKSRISTDSIVIDATLPPPPEDERLVAWLNLLNNKMDYLISLFSPRREDFVSIPFEPLNLSGSGMRLNSTEQFDIGDMLEIRMVLQTYPAKVLQLYGEVVRIESVASRPGTYSVGVRFIGVSEEVRSEILKFDFRKHREKLLKSGSS